MSYLLNGYSKVGSKKKRKKAVDFVFLIFSSDGKTVSAVYLEALLK